MSAPTVCQECGYNLPHHSHRCSQAPKPVYRCGDHDLGQRRTNDDGQVRRPCVVCGTPTVRAFAR